MRRNRFRHKNVEPIVSHREEHVLSSNKPLRQCHTAFKIVVDLSSASFLNSDEFSHYFTLRNSPGETEDVLRKSCKLHEGRFRGIAYDESKKQPLNRKASGVEKRDKNYFNFTS
ncbi:hypothetical protein TNCV_3732931 [Trichonephila clavipes]|nr:hypothetical protein TNCV_3732931 [Trichonephila clavipes]